VPGTSLRCWSRTVLSQFTALASLRTCFWRSVKLHWLCLCHKHYSVPAHKARQITMFTVWQCQPACTDSSCIPECLSSKTLSTHFYVQRSQSTLENCLSWLSQEEKQSRLWRWDSMFLLIVSVHLQNYAVSQPDDHTVLSMLTGDSRNFKICRHIVR
jgi:hypothetical protein